MAKETAYEHVAGSDTFTITAAERWSIGMVHRLKEKYPDEVDIRYTNSDGSMVVRFPFEWMRIVPKRHIEMSDERKQELSDRMRAIREKSNG